MDSLSQDSTFVPGCCAPSMLSTLRRMDSEAVMCRLPSRRWASWAASARSGRLKLSVPCVTNSDSVRPGVSGAVCQWSFLHTRHSVKTGALDLVHLWGAHKPLDKQSRQGL